MSEDNPLLPAIEDLFASPGPSLTEYSLIQLLKERGLVDPAYSSSPLSLFRVHFCVFNALYRLQQRLAEQSLALVISPLAIYVRAAESNTGRFAPAEMEDQPLRDYYLDWTHYRAATGESVEELLQDFWRGFARRSVPDLEERRAALAVLELDEPATPADIKRQYRRLAMEHHPDRGGSAERLRSINAALAVLEPKR